MAREGRIAENQVRNLYSLALGVRAGLTIVEIGTYRGRSRTALAFGSEVSPADCLVNKGKVGVLASIVNWVVGPHISARCVGRAFALSETAELL
jgi:hypothetical protein